MTIWRDLKSLERSVLLAVGVAALGYFVDIYDLLLFSIVRVASLKGVGVGDENLMSQGVLLINVQMAGLLIGGILWGILGDRKGRLSVLFGSIFLYSAANIANAFVQTVPQYAALRFIAGIGLAGELGAGITLVSEILPLHLRGYGTTIVASVGILGAVVGGLVGGAFDWRVAYIVGGALGFLILLLRVGVRESGMFHKTKQTSVGRGDFRMILRSLTSLKKYIAVIFIGIPIWYVIGILVTFTPEFGKSFGMSPLPTSANAVMYTYLGLAFGDFSSGFFSQVFRNRLRVILFYILGTALAIALHLTLARQSVPFFYASCVFMGFWAGYWAMFVTVAAEQFGTNIRSTVTTTVPNFVRGSVIPLTMLFQWGVKSLGMVESSVTVGVLSLALALFGIWVLEETFHKDLDYLES